MAKKVFILTEIMRSSKSGYFIEGTDIAMDFPDKYPLPLETEVLEKGVPVALRCLPHCGYLEKEKQIKNGFPQHYQWSDADRDRVTFKHRRMELDDKRDKIFLDYVERVGWMEGNEEKKVRQTTKTIFMPYDEDVLLNREIADEEQVVGAKNYIFNMKDGELRKLYHLANPATSRNDGLVTLAAMKKHLLQIAEVNPAFILNGIKSSRDKLIVLVSQAVDANVVSFDFPGQVALYDPIANDWVSLINVNDIGGIDEKFDRLVEYLQTEQGATDVAIIEKRLKDQ